MLLNFFAWSDGNFDDSRPSSETSLPSATAFCTSSSNQVANAEAHPTQGGKLLLSFHVCVDELGKNLIELWTSPAIASHNDCK